MMACSVGVGEAAGRGCVDGARVHDSCAVITKAISKKVKRCFIFGMADLVFAHGPKSDRVAQRIHSEDAVLPLRSGRPREMVGRAWLCEDINTVSLLIHLFSESRMQGTSTRAPSASSWACSINSRSYLNPSHQTNPGEKKAHKIIGETFVPLCAGKRVR